MPVNQSDGVAPLIIVWQISQKVGLCFGRVADPGIQYRMIERAYRNKRKLVFWSDIPFVFDLVIIISRKEGQFERTEKELQVRSADREYKC